MNPLFRTKPALLAVTFCCCASANAVDSTQPAAGTPPSVVERVEKAVERGAKAAASGVKKGAQAAASGVERGAKAAARGIEHGATATAHAAKTVASKVAPSPAASSAASH